MVKTWTRGALCAVVVMVIAGAIGVPRTADAHPPPFFWMADLSTHERRVGIDLTAGQVFRDPLLGDILGDENATVIAASLSGQFALTDQLAVVARIPFGHVGGANGLFDDSSVILGNGALGVQFVPLGSERGSDIKFGLGLALSVPTASDGLVEAQAARVATTLFLPDVARFSPDITGLRARADLRVEGESLFLQAELAYDRLFADGDDLDLLLGGIGLGVTLSPYFALLGELNTVSFILEDVDDDFVHSLDLGMRYHDPRVMAGFRLYLPIDDELLGFGLGAELGVRF